jgi:phosphoribosyl-ATP pyrophosphohydrolase
MPRLSGLAEGRTRPPPKGSVPMRSFSLADLETIVARRASAPASESYTAASLEKGAAYCARKFGEEAIEAIIAATENDRPGLVAESADVLFHLLVVWKARGIALDEVMAELERRTAQSGHAEKASRSAGPATSAS